jgi:hypothetical protein
LVDLAAGGVDEHAVAGNHQRAARAT